MDNRLRKQQVMKGQYNPKCSNLTVGLHAIKKKSASISGFPFSNSVSIWWQMSSQNRSFIGLVLGGFFIWFERERERERERQ
jgi:hypothetical protein